MVITSSLRRNHKRQSLLKRRYHNIKTVNRNRTNYTFPNELSYEEGLKELAILYTTYVEKDYYPDILPVLERYCVRDTSTEELSIKYAITLIPNSPKEVVINWTTTDLQNFENQIDLNSKRTLILESFDMQENYKTVSIETDGIYTDYLMSTYPHSYNLLPTDVQKEYKLRILPKLLKQEFENEIIKQTLKNEYSLNRKEYPSLCLNKPMPNLKL